MKKEQTLDKIIKSAVSVFSKFPYDEVALSSVCFDAGISNGNIYNYFKTKEEIFRYLLNETCERLEDAFEKISGTTLEERLESFININFYMAKKEFDIIKIYREGQYKFIEYEQKLRKIYILSVERIFGRTINEVEYLYIMSGIRFINVHFTKYSISLDVKFLTKIILNGICKNVDIDFVELKNQTLYKLSPFNTNETRSNFIEIGEQLFGNCGYHNIKISDIVEKVGVSVGSFYNYFKNKENFLKEITTELSKSILFFLKYNEKESVNLLDKYICHMYLIITFFEKTPYRYQIIRESEFISEDISGDYVKKLESLYIDSLNETTFAEEEKKIISNFLLGLNHYIAIELYFTKNISNKFDLLRKLSFYLSHGVKNSFMQ